MGFQRQHFFHAVKRVGMNSYCCFADFAQQLFLYEFRLLFISFTTEVRTDYRVPQQDAKRLQRKY